MSGNPFQSKISESEELSREAEESRPAADPALGTGINDDAPLAQPQRSPMLATDIADRAGNYVVSFGFPGSGKTTLHAFLLRYLMQEGAYKTEMINRRTEGGVDYEVNRVVSDWMKQWQQGRFPAPNPAGESEVRELSFAVQPIKGVRTPLDFSILEVSGEMMQSVIPREGRDPSISRVLRDFFGNQRLRIVLLLLVHPKEHDNDTLFMNLMNYLDTNLSFDIRQKASLGLVISDPDAALTYLRKYRQGYETLAELRGEHCMDFVKHFSPTTYRIYHEWPNSKRKMITRLFIGDVEDRPDGKRLVRPDYRSIEKLFDWVYEQFTGRKPGPTRWQRMVSWIRS